MNHKYRRSIMLGLDGVPYSLIKELAARQVMPKLGALIKNSLFRQMSSSIPEVSSVAWSSMMTGQGPGHHGIFGFTELKRGSYAFDFPSFSDLKIEPFWTAMNRDGARTCIINMPSTYPARALDGMLVSGFVSVDIEKAAYPASLLPVLRHMRYDIDVNAEIAHEDKALFMDHAESVLERRIQFCRWAWNRGPWNCFVFVITETDRIHHFLFPAILDESHPLHDKTCRFYRRIDSFIDELYGWTTETDRFIIMSDHGFCDIHREMYVNAWLRENGWLKLNKTPASSFNDIAKESRAFALDPCRIYLHRKASYPKGTVLPDEERVLLDDIQIGLESWEWNGSKVINKVYRREQIYDGPMAPAAPDLVAVPNDGYDLKAALNKNQTHGRSVFEGMHTGHDAMIIVSDMNVTIPEKPSICDVRRIIEDPS